ncbi:PEP-CTERM sorting domain-containing protein [Coleofasciculus sp.]|uniref:PEP-CTERM sorting domain-containing protein n=1 Tax=Coleofasciculus sp. TaxID=3100458 RepID=UPI0039FA52EF
MSLPILRFAKPGFTRTGAITLGLLTSLVFSLASQLPVQGTTLTGSSFIDYNDFDDDEEDDFFDYDQEFYDSDDEINDRYGLGALLSNTNNAVGIANGLSQTNGINASCNTTQQERNFGKSSLTVKFKCNLNFSKGSIFGFGDAGVRSWRSFYNMFNFRGKSNRRYSLTQNLSAIVSSSASVTGSGKANAYSYVYDWYSDKWTGVQSHRYFLGSSSDYRNFQSPDSNWSNFNGNFYLGAFVYGLASVNGVGNMSANSYITFTSTATITDEGFRRRRSVGSDTEIFLEPTEPDSFVAKKVPEPATLLGLGLVGLFLFKTQKSCSSKHSQNNPEN